MYIGNVNCGTWIQMHRGQRIWAAEATIYNYFSIIFIYRKSQEWAALVQTVCCASSISDRLMLLWLLCGVNMQWAVTTTQISPHKKRVENSFQCWRKSCLRSICHLNGTSTHTISHKETVTFPQKITTNLSFSTIGLVLLSIFNVPFNSSDLTGPLANNEVNRLVKNRKANIWIWNQQVMLAPQLPNEAILTGVLCLNSTD